MRRHFSGAGCGFLRARLVTLHWGGPGPRSLVTTDRPRGASLDGTARFAVSRKRGPGLEMMSEDVEVS